MNKEQKYRLKQAFENVETPIFSTLIIRALRIIVKPFSFG